MRITVVKRPFQQRYEFSVISRLFGQQFPHTLLGRGLIEDLRCIVSVNYTRTVVVARQAAFGSVVDLHAQLTE